MYSGQSFSLEFTAVIPAEAKTLPRLLRPRSLAPQGTACICSIMTRSGCFFLSPANAGTANINTSAVISSVLLVIRASGENCLVLPVAAKAPTESKKRRTGGRPSYRMQPRRLPVYLFWVALGGLETSPVDGVAVVA